MARTDRDDLPSAAPAAWRAIDTRQPPGHLAVEAAVARRRGGSGRGRIEPGFDLDQRRKLADTRYAEVKVSYDTQSTRLHAKAWLFHRVSGFSTVYIGSSNLTHSAQVTGLEWNVRAAERLNPGLIASFERSFATYWADPGFEDFDVERFTRATEAEPGSDRILTPFFIEPYPFQRPILEGLQVQRQRGQAHNLVVAATGTGKTIIAALDYRHLRSELDRARLLFVAHRAEILEQSRSTFRHVLRDGAFGELWAMRALGFCVGIDHAIYMAGQFRRAGIAAVAVTSRSPAEERRQELDDVYRGGSSRHGGQSRSALRRAAGYPVAAPGPDEAGTAELSQRGQDYIHHVARGRRVVLFVRGAKRDANGRTAAYFCVGAATYVEHQSERPMQITWRLDQPPPGDTLAMYRAAVA